MVDPNELEKGSVSRRNFLNDSSRKSARLIKRVKDVYYPGAPHGLTATHQDQVNAPHACRDTSLRSATSRVNWQPPPWAAIYSTFSASSASTAWRSPVPIAARNVLSARS
jgi:hypothetical protein